MTTSYKRAIEVAADLWAGTDSDDIEGEYFRGQVEMIANMPLLGAPIYDTGLPSLDGIELRARIAADIRKHAAREVEIHLVVIASVRNGRVVGLQLDPEGLAGTEEGHVYDPISGEWSFTEPKNDAREVLAAKLEGDVR